jgi:histidinol-phosphate/aromatic aminotransferase/cobyric acid decarboxylase-like protein
MSKAYGLSGVRVGYLCGPPQHLESLRAITPPWVVGLPAQVAAVRALQDPEYYAARWLETGTLREALGRSLRSLGWEVTPGTANFLLCHPSPDGPPVSVIIDRCRERGLWLRDPSNSGTSLGPNALRIAVKDAATNQRMVEILRSVVR